MTSVVSPLAAPAIATRSTPDHQVPGAARPAHTCRNAATRSGRTGTGESEYGTTQTLNVDRRRTIGFRCRYMNPPERLERLLASPVIDVQQPGGGYTRSWRGLVTTEAGTRVFVKAAADERTAQSLRTEHGLYAALEVDWLPIVLAWEDGPEPILILEDLSRAQWPPPWPAESSSLFPTLARIAGTRVPFDLEEMPPLEVSPWSDIMADPSEITGLRIVDLEWIAQHGTRLIDLSSRIDLSGNDLIHADLGAGNLCFSKRGPVIVDWEYVSHGNRYLDVATALLDMRACRAPTPDVLPQPAAWASLLAGLMGIHASRPPPVWTADGTGLRRRQRELAIVAVEWVAELEGW